MKITLVYNWSVRDDELLPVYLKNKVYEIDVIQNIDDGPRRYKKGYKIINFLQCCRMAKKALDNSNDGDIIISMCSTPGILASIFQKRNQKVKILAVNLLCDFSKDNFQVRLRNLFYTKAFRNKNLYATCNTKRDFDKYYSKFDIQGENRIFKLPDGIEVLKNVKRQKKSAHKVTIFSAGASARDWKTLSDVAKKMQTVQFNIVARASDWSDEYDAPNLNVFFNLPHEQYIEKLQNCDYVLIPLNSDVTAGLLVLFDSVNYGKIPLITKTPTTAEYISKDLEDVLLTEMKNPRDIENKIINIMQMEEQKENEIFQTLYSYLHDNFSKESYSNNIIKIIEGEEFVS